jgi:predicted DNA-binding transcriptional regulator AlpA
MPKFSKGEPQKKWLQDLERELPPLAIDTAPQGIPRLLEKTEVCAIAGASFPTLWLWMRAGKFPLARVVGGKSKWLSSDIEAWMASLPIRRLKGHSDGEAA